MTDHNENDPGSSPPETVDTDVLVVRDRASRRRFIRRGAAFALAGGAALAASRAALAADCDRSREGCATSCSDSDSGEGSDPTGRGKRCSNISISRNAVAVEKVKA